MTRYLLCMAVILAALLSVQLMESQEAAPSPTKASTTESESPVITNEALPKGARIYVAPIQNGFETYIVAGLEKKKVPVVVVADRTKADYELTGVSDTDRAGWAKMLFLGSQQTNESASIKVVNLKTGNVVFAYSVNKTNSVRGKQSAGEAVAKHINEKIENRYH
jgi:FlaG/FlaF family flagellin (archaellin)